MPGDHKLSIPVLLGSARVGRQSARVGELVLTELEQRTGAQSEMLDLAGYDFPIMSERLSQMKQPPPGLAEFAAKLARANGLVIVTPEYKGSYPGVLKNALDFLPPGIFHRKPIGIVTVSSGDFGGLSCLAQLRLVCLSMGGLPVPNSLTVARVQELFEEGGEARKPDLTRRLTLFLDDLLWYCGALTQRLILDGSLPT
jgi:NAD(P)H-dependent FMN reductase